MGEADSKTWQLATVVVPVILTGWLTYTVQRTETRVKQELDVRNQQLSAQLTLATELFKRRFDAYETLYKQLIDVNEKLLLQEASHSKSNNAKTIAATNRETADLLAQLNKASEENALHLSDEVFSLTAEAWKAGVDGNSDLLSQKINEVEEQMKKELKAEMENRVGMPAKAAAAPSP